ncbi:hypothetical protein Tco_0261608 [Tanacetum coccineum]
MTTKAQKIKLDNALVAPENRRVIGKCNMRINPGIKPKEPTYQVALDALALTICYPAFLITAEVHKLIKAKKPTTKPKPSKKKAPVKADKGKGKKDFHISHASGSSNGTDLGSGVADEQHHKTSGTDEGTDDDDDDEDDSGDESDDGINDGDDSDKDAGDNNDGNDDDEVDSVRTESDREENLLGITDLMITKPINRNEERRNKRKQDMLTKIWTQLGHEALIPILNQSNEERKQEKEDVDERVHTPDDYELTEEEKIDDEDKIDEDDKVTKELYKDVNVNLGIEDTKMIHADQGGADKTKGPMQSSSVSSDFTSKLLNLENVSPADIEIASLMDTTIRHEETSSQMSSLYSVPIIAILKVTTTIPPPPPFFNPFQQQATPILTPTTSKATTSVLELPDFSSIFKFNERVTNLEHDLSEMKQVNRYSQALSFIPVIEYIDLVYTTVRAVIKEEVNTQLPQFLPQTVSEVASPVIEKNVTESLEAAMEKNKSYDKVDYKRELYDALVTSYQTDKDLFDTYGEVFLLKRSQDNKDKDPPTSFDELYNTSINFSAFVLNRLSIIYLTQEILNVPRLQLNDSTGITLKANRRSLSKKYSTFVTKTKAATYEIKWIKDKVPKLWSPVTVMNRNRLIRTDELHKFSDGTLNDDQIALHDIASGIRMEYLLKRKWSNLDKRRARVMLQAIDKQLFKRRLMRNLEKFVGGREY